MLILHDLVWFWVKKNAHKVAGMAHVQELNVFGELTGRLGKRCTHSTIIAHFRYHSRMQIGMESSGFKRDLTLKVVLTVKPTSRLLNGSSQTNAWRHDDSVHLYMRHLFPLFNQMKLGSGSLLQGWPTQEFGSRGKSIEWNIQFERCNNIFNRTCARLQIPCSNCRKQWCLFLEYEVILPPRHCLQASDQRDLSKRVTLRWGVALSFDQRPLVRLSHAEQSLGF